MKILSLREDLAYYANEKIQKIVWKCDPKNDYSLQKHKI